LRFILFTPLHKETLMIKVGDVAPEFELDSQFGPFKLSQFKGQKNVMLVFYPLDFTPN